ncbi:ABC transporter ATP-binding protein [Robiginitomaculum antarcticum]|uniref:ABC transporter ATP-binding protein n=1 Tax=Robiginitomaculum antarcticum TaxID=437507 RepID=UPI00036E4DDC|nr:ABC transporter ATP-binding protein [Robiginitomaculum antarcticum]
MTALDIDGVTVHYGQTAVLHNLTFSAEQGGLIGLIGPNGSGKTTLIKTICGLISPSSGHVSVAGTQIRRGVDSRKFIGFVPQSIGLYPHLTAAENLRVFAGYCGLPRKLIAKRVGEALIRVGMANRAETKAAELSGGMKRRINFAAAILHEPKLLILDEPTAGVDSPARDAIHKTAKDLAASGMTILLITHELEAAEHYCDKILLLNDGNLCGYGAPSALLSQTFGSQKECVITLQAIPDIGAVTALTALGFETTDHPRQLRKMIPDDELPAISAQIKAAGVQVREIAVREPGLGSLMYKLCRPDPKAAA